MGVVGFYFLDRYQVKFESIIGSVVNKSSRLKSATRRLNANIAIISSAAERISKNSLDDFKENSIQLKGFEQKEKIFYK